MKKSLGENTLNKAVLFCCLLWISNTSIAQNRMTDADMPDIRHETYTPNASVVIQERAYFAIKTNMLYDVALLPNIALEFSLPNKWSVEGEWSCAWWSSKGAPHYYYRLQMGGLEFRKWLGSCPGMPLSGHYIGIYAMGGTYDLRFSDKSGYQSDWSYSVGLTYGYSAIVSTRMNIEFGLGIGYQGGVYEKYSYFEPHNCYSWEGTYRRMYFGPTKLKVSLVWLTGIGKSKSNRR